MSEYNYDEELDEDRAKRLLNFGDDYRNFIDSLSESYSSVASTSLERRQKRSKRMRKKTLPVKSVPGNFSFNDHTTNRALLN